MKSKALEKAVTAAREQARVLEDKANQSERALRAARDRLKQAKANLKLAKHEASQARKASKAAKRASAEAMDASEEAAAAVAALEQRIQAQGPAAPARAKSRKPKRGRGRKPATARPGATVRTRKVNSPTLVTAPDQTGETMVTVPATGGGQEVRIQLPSDITVPTDVFSGNPVQSEEFAVPDSETSSQ